MQQILGIAAHNSGLAPVKARGHHQLVHTIIFNISVPYFQERSAKVCSDLFNWYGFAIGANKLKFTNVMGAFIRVNCKRIFTVYLKTHVLKNMNGL